MPPISLQASSPARALQLSRICEDTQHSFLEMALKLLPVHAIKMELAASEKLHAAHLRLTPTRASGPAYKAKPEIAEQQ